MENTGRKISHIPSSNIFSDISHRERDIPFSKGKVKTTMRYHLTPAGMATINKSNKCWGRCGEKVTPVHCWWECRLVQPLWKTKLSFLKKLKIELPFNLVIPLMGIYLKNPKTLVQKNIYTPIFISALFIITKIWKKPKWMSG